ncbi:MAG: hypothetical protein IJ209_09715, partial [Bacteroidaceae bacterium]|nr:hypothetical protein [Bacteroidaceae bacterium]
MKYLWRYTFSLCCMMSLSSCSKVNLPEPDENTVRQAEVTYLVSPNGLGDNGYNDCIVDGLFRFHEQTGRTASLLEPSDSAEAMAMYRNWVQSHAAADSAMLILGSSVYENIVSQEPPRLAGHGSRVMLMESMLQVESVNSVMVDRYGAAYLAGAMVSDYPALILAAAPGVPTLDMAISGFRDGHERNFPNSSDESLLELQYLADNESGFAKPEEAYGLLYDYIYEREMNLLFDLAIFPLLGGSNIGAVRAVNDLNWSNAMLIGMDTD